MNLVAGERVRKGKGKGKGKNGVPRAVCWDVESYPGPSFSAAPTESFNRVLGKKDEEKFVCPAFRMRNREQETAVRHEIWCIEKQKGPWLAVEACENENTDFIFASI